MVKRGDTWTPREVVSARDEPKPSESVEMMLDIDRLKPRMRALVYEYGAVIVGAMLDDGARDVDQMEIDLKFWRWRKQEEWLATDYITAKVRESLERALDNWTR